MRIPRNFISKALLIFLLLSSSNPAWAQAGATEPTYDIIITGGRIIDGTGGAWFYGDVAIEGDRIARIAPPGMLDKFTTNMRVDARGLVVAPGFIDIQSHSRDNFLTGDGRVISKVTQGITTEIMGEGWSNAPANEKTIAGSGSVDPAEQQFVEAFKAERGFNNWLEAMQKHGASANLGLFVGGATVRMYVKGMAQGKPTKEELDQMRALVKQAMEDGAFGIATALIYPPGNFATTEELIEMSKAMAPYGGIYISHMRSEADQFLEAMDEAMRIGREGGVPVEIYHLKAGGRRNWAKAQQAIDKINAARAAGQDVSADMYPYVAGGTGLTACLPPWASADGKLLANLRDPAMREKIKAEVLKDKTDWENLCQLATPEGVLIVGVDKPENKVFAGMRLSEMAAKQGKPWLDAAIDLIISEEQRVGTIFFMMSEDNIKLQLRQPWMKFGTDAGGADPDKPEGLVHPRSYGTYPRILGKYVREEKVIPLEDAIRKMTSAVANRLSIRDRGLLREGMYADVVVFDPKTVADRATFEKPHQLSVGIKLVLVNGTAVVADGMHTGAKPGRIVRGPGYRGVPRTEEK